MAWQGMAVVEAEAAGLTETTPPLVFVLVPEDYYDTYHSASKIILPSFCEGAVCPWRNTSTNRPREV